MKNKNFVDNNLFEKIEVKDIKEIDLSNVFLHYTDISNLSGIIEKGLEPRIGINARLV